MSQQKKLITVIVAACLIALLIIAALWWLVSRQGETSTNHTSCSVIKNLEQCRVRNDCAPVYECGCNTEWQRAQRCGEPTSGPCLCGEIFEKCQTLNCLATNSAINASVNAQTAKDYCESDNDCAITFKSCSECGCDGEAVSKKYWQTIKPDCSNYHGGVCDLGCPWRLKCVNNKCIKNPANINANINTAGVYDFPDIKTEEGCIAQGAEWVHIGMITAVCQLPAPDAGKTCAKSTDCLRQCQIRASTETVGLCSTYTLGGCYSFLDKGGKPNTICVD